MKLRHCCSWKPSLFCALIITIFFPAFSSDTTSPDDPSGNCLLKSLSEYPYQPSGECSSDLETIKIWDTFKTTRCCGNALSAMTAALALHAKITNSSTIFMPEDQWKNCTGSFFRQHSVSVQDCGFGDLCTSDNTKCSSISLSSVIQDHQYQVALDRCSGFGNMGFDEACGNCTAEIGKLRDHLAATFGVKDDEDFQRAVCGVASVVFVAANLNNLSIFGDLYRCLPAMDTSGSDYMKIKASTAKTILAVVIAAIALILIIMLVRYVTTKKKPKEPTQLRDVSAWSGLYRFSIAEIENALNFGGEKYCLGHGSAGQVYKGILPSGQVVAIKEIYVSDSTSDSFLREVSNLTRVRHPNLVCLLGCCMEKEKQYLVYEYCPEGNLAHRLLHKNNLLTWEKRVQILRNCALALRYLHQYIDGYIVHRDIKLTNILLTEKLEPKLSDFGLARMLGMDETRVFTGVRGTIGYMDPEYMTNAKLTCASDIYSFGIVALQILSGQKVFDMDLEARVQLTTKANDVNMGMRPLSDFEDPSLDGKVNKADFRCILQIAVLCVAKSSKGRPSTDVVFDELDKVFKNTIANRVRQHKFAAT